MTGIVSAYSPRIHKTPRKTLPDLTSGRVEMSFSQMEERRVGNFSTTSLYVVFYMSFSSLFKKRVFDVPNECDNIERGWVVGVAEEFHESVNDACCDF